MEYNAIYDLVSTCSTHILTAIAVNYGNILPDIGRSVAPVKIMLFIVRQRKEWFEDEGIKSHALSNPSHVVSIVESFHFIFIYLFFAPPDKNANTI